MAPPMMTPSQISIPKSWEKTTPTSPHLPHDVGETDEDGADDRDNPGEIRVVTVADEVRDGGFAELPEEGNHQDGEENVAAGPPHEKTAGIVA